MAEPRCSLQTSTFNGAHRLTLRMVPVSRRVLAAGALLCLAAGLALNQGLTAPRPAIAPTSHTRLAANSGLLGLPLAAQGPASSAVGASEPAYRVSGSGGRLAASNPAQHLHASFGSAGVLVSAHGTTAGFALRSVQFGRAARLVGPAVPTAHANRVSYAYGGLQAWYANGPLGLEQGFTISRSGGARRADTLTLSLALSGNARPQLAGASQTLTLSHAGSPSLRYSGLLATDARGRVLHSSLQLHNGVLQLRVDTRGARFPVNVDPFVQVGSKLAGSGEIGNGEFGFSVAISGNGQTAIVGAPKAEKGNGEAFVFTRTGEGGTWVQQSELTGSGESAEGEPSFGYSVALSENGDTAMIGGPGNEYGGAVWMLARSDETWTQQKIVGGGGGFGDSVALSSSGTTGLVGAPVYGGHNKGSADGAVWVVTLSGETWSVGQKLESSEAAKKDLFGTSVALSGEGSTALVGAPGVEKKIGAAWVFKLSGETWAQQGSELTGTGETGKGAFGSSVALSGEGNTALIGAPADHSKTGAVWVFARSSETWRQEGGKLTVSGTKTEEKSKGTFGASLALSANGKTALIGGPKFGHSVGGAWIFTSAEESWTQAEQLRPSEEEVKEQGNAQFGAAVALSGEGNSAFASAPRATSGTGAAWAFASE